MSREEFSLELLKSWASKISNYELAYICHQVLKDGLFLEAPASNGKHQGYVGGLLVHTAEVMELAMAMAQTQLIDVDLDALIAAIIWHDYGKIYDYKEKEGGGFDYTEHSKLIGHLPRSYAMFMITAQGLPRELSDKIGHIMLAHHGRREWGSPKEPQIPEAYIIHFADMLSAHATKDNYEG
jgi:3'-5' exoribonuclease